MAELFESDSSITLPPMQAATAQFPSYVGVPEIDQYIHSLPEEQRQDAIAKITAPKTGEDIFKEMLAADQQKIVWDPSKEDWIKLKEYQRTIDNDNLELITKTGAHIYEMLGKAIAGGYDEPSKIPRSVVEAFAQGTKSMYGIMAMSADSTSPQAQFFNAIKGYEEDSDAAYREFLRARNVVRELNDLWDGSKTILMDKNLINHDFVQGASMVADASWLVPFGKVAGTVGRFVGIGEKAAITAAKVEALKDRIIGGSIKYAAGAPIEMLGRATRGTIDYGVAKAGTAFENVIGVSAKEFQDTVNGTMRVAGVASIGAGSFGYTIPYASSITGAYTLGSAAVGVGEAIGAIGNQIMKGPRGLASYAADALKESARSGVQLTPHAQRLLKIIDKFDPLLSYGGTIGQGLAKGGAVGAGIGWWAGGEEGLWSGVGAGMALGSAFGVTGKVVSDLSGATRRLHTHITAKYVKEAIREHNPQQAAHWDNGEIWARSHGSTLDGILAAGDRLGRLPDFEIYNDKMYRDYLKSNGLDPNTFDGVQITKDGDMIMGRRQFYQHNGYVVENKANGRVKIVINADEAGRPTIGHELYHSLNRVSAMKDLHIGFIKDAILGVRDPQGKMVQRPVVNWDETKQFFRRYLKANYKDPAEYADAMTRLEAAEKEWETSGTLINDPEFGRPFLEHLTEEYGAYYFSHLLMDKPIDWLYYGGDLPGIRGAFESAAMNWNAYMRSRLSSVAPEFNFNRTYKDPVTGVEKLVTIDQVFAPLTRDIFGRTKERRIANPALDALFRDMLRMERAAQESGTFDISKMNKSAQKNFIDSNGLDGVFERRIDGSYKIKDQKTIKRENRVKGKAVYDLLMGVPVDKRTFRVDAEGNIRGPFSDEILDMIVNSGHMSREMANKVKMFQSIVSKDTQSNVVDFGGIGRTMEMLSDGSNPPRLKGDAVPFKFRAGVVFGLDIKISKDGNYQFTGNMLDYNNIMTRANNQWSDLFVQSLWNGNHTDFTTDLFRYLENASKDPTDPTRVPSAQLWTDNKGGERRNVFHQVMGMAKAEADTYINPPNGEIARNHLSTVMSFSLNNMTNLRIRDQRVPFAFENAYRDLVRNFHPNERDGEPTPNGMLFKHPSGYTFHVKQNESQRDTATPYGSVEVFDDKGVRLGRFDNMNLASEAALKHARKNPPSVMYDPILRDQNAFGSEADLRQYATDRGYNEFGMIHATEAKDVRVFDLHYPTKNRGENPAGFYFRRTSDPAEMKQYGPVLYKATLSLHNPWGLDGRVYNADGTVKRQNNISPKMREEFKAILEKIADRFGQDKEYFVTNKLNTFERTRSFIRLGLSDRAFGPYEQRDFLIRHGYDGVNDGSDLVVFTPEQIKSDKLITHDQYGNVIPKAQRFNRRSADIYRSPAEGRGEGGRTYTKEQLAEGFIGREASKRPELIKGMKVYYGLEKGGPNSEAITIRDASGDVVATMNMSVYMGDAVPNAYIKGAYVFKHQGKGYGKILYSEAMERLRSLGIREVEGTVLDPKERPIKIRRRIIDEENQRIGRKDDTVVLKDEDNYDNIIATSYLKKEAWYAPAEGRGEEAVYGSTSREMPRFRDSLIGFRPYAIPEGSDPFPFNDLIDYDKGFDGKPLKLSESEKPSPQRDTFYAFLKWHQQFEKTLTFRDALTFLDVQGSSVHSNIARSYISQWARAILSLAPADQLDRGIRVHSGKDAYGGAVETVLSTKGKSKRGYAEDPRLKKDFNLQEEEQKIRDEETPEKDDTVDEDDFSGEEQVIKMELEGEGTASGNKFFIESLIDSPYPYPSLSLEMLVNKLFETGSEHKHVVSGSKGSKTLKASKEDAIRLALQGRSFEGVALEEIYHSLDAHLNNAAIANDSTGLLEQILKAKTDSSGESGVTWKRLVESFVGTIEKRIRDFGAVDENGQETVHPVVLSYARFFKVFIELNRQQKVMNTKTGRISNAWDSEAIEHNAQYFKVNEKTGKTTFLSNRSLYKGSWVGIHPSASIDSSTPLGYYISSGAMTKDIGSNYKRTGTGLFQTRLAYRLKYPHEMLVGMFNDPMFLAFVSEMKVRPDLLDGLSSPWVEKGFSKNLASLHNQMAHELARYLAVDGKPKYSMAHMLLEEQLRQMDLLRRGRKGTKLDTSDEKNDIKPVSFELSRDDITAFLPERPNGFLTPWEKEYVSKHRQALSAWKKEGMGDDLFSKGPDQPMSDFEAWQELKNHSQHPWWNWYYEPSAQLKRAGKIKDIKESEVRGVKLPAGMLEPTPFTEGLQRLIITDNAGLLDVVYVDKDGNVINPETGKIDKKKTKENQDEINKRRKEQDEFEIVKEDETPPPIEPPVVERKTEEQRVPAEKENDVPVMPERTGEQAPVRQMPKREYTKQDFRVWRDWIPVQQSASSYTLKNGMNYVIMMLNGKFRVYNPAQALLGVYNDEEQAKRRVQREEVRR
jgi:hypothetical protein